MKLDKYLEALHKENIKEFWIKISDRFPTLKEYKKLGYNEELKELYIEDVRKN